LVDMVLSKWELEVGVLLLCCVVLLFVMKYEAFGPVRIL
jgi:hypothetical protein